MKEKNIIIVDDHTLFRQGLATIINRMQGFSVIAEAGDGKEFLELLNLHHPDLVLMDIRMPVMNGMEAVKNALRKYPDLLIAALSSSDDEDNLQAMLQAGAVGFLTKNIDRDNLENALHLLSSGQNYYSPELLHYFTNRYLGVNVEQSDLHITKREKEVLKLIAKGFSTKEIADKLFISTRTVEGHKANLIGKTGSKNLVNLLIFAIKNGLVSI